MDQSVRKITACLVAILLAFFASQGFAFAQRGECNDRLKTSEEMKMAPLVRTFVTADQRLLKLRSEIVERVRKGDFPSISIGVIKDGRILWEESVGWANKESRIVATPRTPYGLASLGKSITATAVMVLVERGRVELDAPISRYLGGVQLSVFEGNPDQVTVRRVLNMTAAIPHGHATFFTEKEMRQYSADLVRNRGIVVFPPGEIYIYSNFAYAILEQMIEKVSGKSYSEFLAAEVFGPLGMTNSFVGARTEFETIATAVHYGDDGSRLTPLFPLPRNSLAMYSSVDDLLGYAMFHLGARQFKGRQIVGDKALEQMHRLRGEAPRSLIALGFGSLDLDEKRLWLLTNGRAGGTQATLSMVPSEGLAVVCLINSSGQVADELAFRISDALVPGFLGRAQQIIGEYETWADQPYKPTPELLGEWKGFISMKSGQVPLTLLFQPDGDVHVKVERHLETILSDVGYREGLLTGRFLADLPMEEAAGHPHAITISIRLKGNRLSGSVTSDFTNERGRFSLAAYVRLSRP